MTAEGTYRTPTAFRQALTDRLRVQAKAGSWSLQQLQRHVAYDALLQRLYRKDGEWLLKGAIALIARDLSRRGSIDLDLYRAAPPGDLEAALRVAANEDLGDWFNFEVGGRRASSDATTGIRLPVEAFIGTAPWAQFHVDLVGSDVLMTAEPDDVPPLGPASAPNAGRHNYRVYPLVDHVADKVAATFDRYGVGRSPSTRYRDLLDLVSIILGASVTADAQKAALASEARRRGLTLPDHFDVPDQGLWRSGYSAEARRNRFTTASTLDEALAIVRPFLNPLLDGTAQGIWDQQTAAWRQRQP